MKKQMILLFGIFTIFLGALFAQTGLDPEPSTPVPLWLGIIIMVLAYGANVLLKIIDVEKQKKVTGEKFKFLFWLATNKWNIILTIVIISLLLLAFPDLPGAIAIYGDTEVGSRLLYILIGFAPYKVFKMLIPEQFQGGDNYEVLKENYGVK